MLQQFLQRTYHLEKRKLIIKYNIIIIILKYKRTIYDDRALTGVKYNNFTSTGRGRQLINQLLW